MDNLATVHHDQTVSQACRLVHGVSRHQGGELVAGDHVLGAHVADLPAADDEVSALLDKGVFAEVLAEVPDAWLEPVPGAPTPDAVRAAYVAFLAARLGTRQWLPQGVLA